MSHHTRNLMFGLATLPMAVGNCGVVRDCGGNLLNAIGQIVRDPLPAAVPPPTPDDPRPDPSRPMNCTVIAEPGDASLHAPYTPVDPRARLNGWAWWSACVISARALGLSLPTLKITGDLNDPFASVPVIQFFVDTAPIPIDGRGSGHYQNPQGANITVWRRAYIEAVPT